MTTLEIFSIISSIATLITALLIYLTLKEMARQRKDTIIPEIVSINQYIFGSKNPIAATGCPTFWQKHHPDDPSKESNIIDPDYKISLLNLGNGAAKQISLEWSYDIEGLLKKINEFSQILFSDLYIKKTSENWLSFKRKDGSGGRINLELDLKGSIDYLLPISIKKIDDNARLPYSYLQLVSQYIQLLSQDKKGTLDKNLLQLYPIKLKISYSDIAGNKFIKHCQFSIDITILGVTDGAAVTSFNGSFQVKSI